MVVQRRYVTYVHDSSIDFILESNKTEFRSNFPINILNTRN